MVSHDRQDRAAGIVKGAHYAAPPIAVVALEPLTRKVGPGGGISFVAGVAALAMMLFLVRTYGMITTDGAVPQG